jgi:hypothetical protein
MKTLLLPALGSIALLAGGCATEQTHNGSNTYILDGLVTVKSGSYQEPQPASFSVDTTKWFGHGSPSGTSVSVLDDAFEFNNY